MRLGDLIDTLSLHDADTPVRFDSGGDPYKFGSWRGRYNELTLYPHGEKPMTAGRLLEMARKADGGTFSGWKGGEYVMDRDTPVWADDAGDCHYRAILGFQLRGGVLVLMTQNIAEYV